MISHKINGTTSSDGVLFNSSTLPYLILEGDKLYMEYDLTLTIRKGTNDVWELQNIVDHFGIRALPIQNNSRISVTLNNTTFTIDGNIITDALLYILRHNDETLGLTTTSRYLDVDSGFVSSVSSYLNSLYTVDNRNLLNYLYKIEFTDSTVINDPVMMTYYFEKDLTTINIQDQNVIADYTQVKLYLKVNEPLICSPLMFSDKALKLFNVRNLNIDFKFVNTRFFEGTLENIVNNNSTYTSIKSEIVNPVLHILYNKIKLPITNNVQQLTFYEYTNINKNLGNLTSVRYDINANTIYNKYKSNLIRFVRNPLYIMIYATNKLLNENLPFYNVGTNFLQINTLSLRVNDNQSIYQGFNSYDLYRISLKNNLNMTYSQFSGRIGGIIILSRNDLLLDNDNENIISLEYDIELKRQRSNPIINSDVILTTVLIYDKIITNDF